MSARSDFSRRVRALLYYQSSANCGIRQGSVHGILMVMVEKPSDKTLRILKEIEASRNDEQFKARLEQHQRDERALYDRLAG